MPWTARKCRTFRGRRSSVAFASAFGNQRRKTASAASRSGSAAFAKSCKASTCHDPDRSSALNPTRSRRRRGGLCTVARYADIVSNDKAFPPLGPSIVFNSGCRPCIHVVNMLFSALDMSQSSYLLNKPPAGSGEHGIMSQGDGGKRQRNPQAVRLACRNSGVPHRQGGRTTIWSGRPRRERRDKCRRV